MATFPLSVSEPASWLSPSAPAWLAEKVGATRDRSIDAAAIAAGLVLRFDEPEDLTVETLLSLSGDPAVAKAAAWWAGLPADRREELCSLARVVTTQLRLEVEDLEESLDPGDAGWQARLGQALRRRDEIASQHATLRAVGEAEEIDGAVECLDAVLRPLLDALIVPFRTEDPFLAEVAARSPSAWWAEPARA